MNRSLLSIGIILSLGSVGCAGLGIQYSSSLASQVRADRGVEELWWSGEESPSEGLEPPVYAEQQLNALWDPNEHAPQLPVESGSNRSASSDLWNPASSRGWQVVDEPSSSGYELSRSDSRPWY